MKSVVSQGNGYTIVENASLNARNTFRVAAQASMLIDVRKAAALPELFGYSALKTQPLLILGAGSNILFTRDWPGVVLSYIAHGIEVLDENATRVQVRVEAGEDWNNLVRWSLANGLHGLENLILIPGTVGAAPIQNIGAYGTEVSEFIHGVEVWDRESGAFECLSPADCAFGYRDSLFKRQPNRYLVTAVVFDLPRTRALQIDYNGVREELASLGPGEPSASKVAEAIARLRMRKLPNPALIGNAGSFFKNPIVSHARATALLNVHADLPHWTTPDGQLKLSAAWLIEFCDFKGFREGDAAVSEQHALVLVNQGGASGKQIQALAARICDGVLQRFNVKLEPEPLIV